MSKFYVANIDLFEYLVELGLTFHDREDEDVKYFTDHLTGKQIKLNYRNNLVVFIGANGRTVEFSSAYTNNQIDTFLND
jgi:hypothetical protein